MAKAKSTAKKKTTAKKKVTPEKEVKVKVDEPIVEEGTEITEKTEVQTDSPEEEKVTQEVKTEEEPKEETPSIFEKPVNEVVEEKPKSPRKVQKQIKYYKTPLMPMWNEALNLWGIKFEGKQGVIPRELEGHFTSKELAKSAIDMFLDKHMVEYID